MRNHKPKTTRPPKRPLRLNVNPGVARERLVKLDAELAANQAAYDQAMTPAFNQLSADVVEVTVQGQVAGTITRGRWVFQPGEFHTSVPYVGVPAIDRAVTARIRQLDSTIEYPPKPPAVTPPLFSKVVATDCVSGSRHVTFIGPGALADATAWVTGQWPGAVLGEWHRGVARPWAYFFSDTQPVASVTAFP